MERPILFAAALAVFALPAAAYDCAGFAENHAMSRAVQGKDDAALLALARTHAENSCRLSIRQFHSDGDPFPGNSSRELLDEAVRLTLPKTFDFVYDRYEREDPASLARLLDPARDWGYAGSLLSHAIVNPDSDSDEAAGIVRRLFAGGHGEALWSSVESRGRVCSDPDCGKGALHLAMTRARSASVVDAVIQESRRRGVDPRAYRTPFGNSLVHLAAVNATGHGVKITQRMVEVHGVDGAAVSPAGETPLAFASRNAVVYGMERDLAPALNYLVRRFPDKR